MGDGGHGHVTGLLTTIVMNQLMLGVYKRTQGYRPFI